MQILYNEQEIKGIKTSLLAIKTLTTSLQRAVSASTDSNIKLNGKTIIQDINSQIESLEKIIK